MRATLLNCTLKPSPQDSNTESLADHMIETSYADTDQGHDWSQKTARAMGANLVTVAEALAANPLQAPPD